MAQEIVFVTGGGSGIGMGLASAFHGRGATVIIGGRKLAALEAVAARHPGMQVEEIDVSNAASVANCAVRISQKYPQLTTVINNAGIQHLLDFNASESLDDKTIAEEIDINFKGLVRVSNTFLPLLKRQQSARLIHVGSGLAYVPLVAAPVYSATKAAVHSFTISLRRQLAASSVKVIEIIPPVVETGLHRAQPRKPPQAMTLDAFVKAAMLGLDAGKSEIPVGLAKVLRIASRIVPRLFLKIINKNRR
jgi:uncharacterized oxidoreductase